ncbi:signal transduction histidine kinase [Lipingzhangella halophila]|uniref:histidine kinase n=1 Tax=Lipingzhangella halophila TaxID=1783352 RepID=A0A7W7REF9_9ACTN|nr:sensor histidine kinase [Lipingzhangella halophila]MBB4930482.1 signal transduction histidine kinase [Lipingzhangella halophila]
MDIAETADPRPSIFRRLGRRELLALDGLTALGYLLVLAAVRAPPDAQMGAVLLAAAVTGASIAVRRLWPVPAFGLALTGTLLATAWGMGRWELAAVVLTLYQVAVVLPRRRWEPTLTIGTLSVGGLVLVSVTGTPVCCGSLASTALVAVPVLGGTWMLGRVIRERRAAAARSATQLADWAVAEERLRIARELHDSVAHSMSLIAVKAGIANHVAHERPEEARDALRVIESTSRDTLAEMRRMLGVLRSDEQEPRADLEGLVEHAAMAGVRVDMVVHGIGEVPDGVASAVHRIVREAVTNVVKHAAPARCRVRVAAGGGTVRVEVRDDGPGARVLPDTGNGTGHGLLGMRERAAMHGGVLTAEALPEGGFRVAARIPYEPASREAT